MCFFRRILQRALYAHLKSISVSDGQQVTKGQLIGVMGNSGADVGSNNEGMGVHLHFEYSAGDPWKNFFNDKYYSKIVFEQNVRNNNYLHNNDKTVVNIIDNYYYQRGTYYYYDESKGMPIINVTPTSPVNLGDSFTAPILNKEHWKIIENNNGIVQTADETGTSNQLWTFERQSDGSYKISSCLDGRCLDVANASSASGAKVWVVDSNDTNAQRWFIYEKSGGYVLKAKCTECVLDLPYIDPTNGNQLQMYTENNTGAQIWAIYRGDECKLTAPTLSVTPGKSTTNTVFTWNDVYGESGYHVKIWKGEVWDGDAYHIEWNTASGYGIQLPTGTYQAYVDATNYYEMKMSNVVTFTVQAGQYTISYNANGGTGAPVSQTKVWGSNLTLSSTVPTGKAYTVTLNANGGSVTTKSINVSKRFKEWNTKSDGSGASYAAGGTYSANAAATLYAQWNDATLSTTLEPTRDGYYFRGWYDSAAVDSDGIPTGNAYTSSTTITKNITLYAIWEKADTLYYGDLDRDGTVSNIDMLTANKYRLNEYTPEYNINEFLLRGDLDRDGEVEFKDLALINGIILKKKTQADYEEAVKEVKVSNIPCYNYERGDTLETKDLQLIITFDTGAAYAITDGLTVSGYDPYQIGIQTITVRFYQFSATYKVEVEAPTYTVAYNANGGTGAPADQTKTYDITLKLSSTKPKRDGYTFLGWSASSTATSATYQPGGSFTSNTDTTLYAVWKQGCEAGSHSYSFKVTKAPTTSATGTLTRSCSKCTSTATVTLPKLTTTDYNYTIPKAATCTATGTGRYTWKTTTYGSFYFDVTIPATGHSYTTKVTAPTCTAQGYTTHTCSCGYSYKDSYINATGHSYSYKATKAPTTSATGTLTGTCSKCSGTTTVTLPKLSTTDYNYKVTKAASCSATGTGRYTWKTTTYGSFYFDVTIPATDHSYTTKVTAPTCTAQGYTTHTCSCGYSYKDSYINATGHSYSYNVTKAATISATGTLTGICSKCSDTTTVTLPKLTTTDYNYKVAKAATCSATGTGRYTWKTTTYGSFYFDVTIEKTAHSWNAATCTSAQKCSVCGTTSDSALGHSYSYKVTKTPTTVATGTLTGTCSKCSDTTTVTLPKLNTTDYTYKVTKEATCTATGTGRYTWNTTTYGSFYFDVTIDRIGHDWTEKVIDTAHLRSQATKCTEHATYWYDCARCSEISTEHYYEGTQTGAHSFTEQLKDEAHLVPGSGVPAQYYYDCAYCDTVGTETFTDILRGDLDGDGDVDEDDAIYLLQHVLMPELFLLSQQADFDSNGEVDEDDAIYLLQHVLMPGWFPLMEK